MTGRDRIAVVGGGIIGASLAYRLAQRGAQVTLLEKTRAAAGATGNSFAWINANFHTMSDAYYQLRRLGVLAWAQLQRELGGELPLQWGGSLLPVERGAPVDGFEKRVRRQQVRGYSTRLIGPEEIRALEPHLCATDLEVAAYAEEEAALEPVGATEVLLRRAAELGARVLVPCEVTGLDLRNGRLRGLETKQGTVEADVAIIAAGVDTPRLASMAGLQVPLVPSPGVLAHTQPMDCVLGRVILTPTAHLKQTQSGRVVIGTDHDTAPTQEATRERGTQLLATGARLLPPLAGAALERVTLGLRPLPRDGYPIVGFSPHARGVYVAVTHSGVTLAPVLAQLISLEVLDCVAVELLEPYRLDRFDHTSG